MTRAMSDSAEPILLDDARMQHFIDRGSVTLQSALPHAYHDELCATLERVIAAEGNPGNNLLPRIPQIARILDDPHVIGGLSSILGPGYTMHAHRYCHVNTPGRQPTRIHTDSPEDFFHRDRWALLFYYPQDTPPELGPTGVLPGSQYHAERPDEIPMRKLAGEAGTFVIVVLMNLTREVFAAVSQDSISQFAHIAGGICGSLFGFAITRAAPRLAQPVEPDRLEE